MVHELLSNRPSDPYSFMMGYIQAIWRPHMSTCSRSPLVDFAFCSAYVAAGKPGKQTNASTLTTPSGERLKLCSTCLGALHVPSCFGEGRGEEDDDVNIVHVLV